MISDYLYRRINLDYLFIGLIIISPFAFYLHLFAPDDSKIWLTPLFSLDAGCFQYVEYYLWVYSYKFLTLGLLIIWFLTCKHKWKLILLIPFGSEVYRLVSFINERYLLVDNFSIVQGIPFILFSIFTILFIDKKVNYLGKERMNGFDINFEIYELLEDLATFNGVNSNSISDKFKSLKKQKKDLKRREYLIKLIELNDELTTIN